MYMCIYTRVCICVCVFGGPVTVKFASEKQFDF